MQSSLQDVAFDSMPSAALVVDRSGTIILANEAMLEKAQERTGMRDCVGKSLTELFARDAEFLMTDLRTAAGGGRLITWLRGAVQEVSGRMCFYVVALPGNTHLAQNFLLVEDQAKSVSRVFSELNTRLRRANEEAAESHRKHRLLKENYELLEQFSMVAAHDLKAPLLNISLLLEFLQEEYGAILDGPAQDLVVAAKESAVRLQNLISSLLNHARSGAADLKLRQINVAETVNCIRKTLALELREAGGEIRIIGDLGTVLADESLFNQLLQNLISNALKYRSMNRAPMIRVERVTDKNGDTKLVISDNGKGFDPSEKDRLFQPFKRLSQTSQIEGSGVGLAICKTVCQRHGWDIDAKGIPDVGAAFEISGIDSTKS